MPETVAIFVDGSNFYHGLKSHGLPTRLDFHKLARRLSGDRRLLRLYYYNAAMDKDQDPERYKDQQRFFAGLQRTDYVTVRLGRLVYRGNPPEPLEKGVDIKIAVDMLVMAPRDNYDTAILVSGDGDFGDLVVAIKDLGKHVETAYFARGRADVLKQVADRVVTLTEDDIRQCALSRTHGIIGSGEGGGVPMSGERLSAFQKAPEDANYKCGQCGHVLSLKKGQLLPPCPKCGHRQFDRTDQPCS